MSNDPAVRRILPQNAQADSFAYAPSHQPPPPPPQQQQQQQRPQPQPQPQQYQQQQREVKKNFVFVDEHNRHKRLKVMRACEGCRRRKIKCDAATTNTWPCSACIRLKLHCVRPNGFDDSDSGFEQAKPDFVSSGGVQGSFQAQVQPQAQAMSAAPKSSSNSAFPPQSGYMDSFQGMRYPDGTPGQHDLNYTTMPPPISMLEQPYAAQNVFPTPPIQYDVRPDASPDSFSQDMSQQELTELLGSLNVNEAGTAPYLRNKASFRREEPAVEDDEDYKSDMPPLIATPGHKIRIPPELMPDEETALRYFDLFFTHVHPYCPVLSKQLFYSQWATDRASISPLILEAIFSISGRLADEPAQGQQWLALATRHADSFMDMPRLSTLQALLLILKAREASPKRGYYYRSWTSVVQCVQMGKDLGLDEHVAEHEAGNYCGTDAVECHMKTRLWQVIFVCENMTGAPQGRTDLAVDIDSVDFNVPTSLPGFSNDEFVVSRNFTYFSRIVRNVSRMNTVYARVKKKQEWGIDPEFVKLAPGLNAWLTELPPDLTVSFPSNGMAPWLPSAFPGNLLSYYYLTRIIFYRPQLMFLDPNSPDGKWKQYMMTCYESAKVICRLQEAIIETSGLSGLQCMLRGFSFTVYAGLSCIVLHLVAMTSPDPDLNSDARDYFTRHMRVIEKVMPSWPMPELQKQVDAVREAFSADTSRPFVLKPTFPYGSPRPSNHSQSPPQNSASYAPPGMGRGSPLGQHPLDTQSAQQFQVSYSSHPISPPISAGPADKSSPTLQSLVMMGQGTQAPGMGSSMAMAEQTSWNPARIFKQWNTSFGPPPQPPPGSSTISFTGSSPTGMSSHSDLGGSLPQQGSQQMAAQQYVSAPMANFITPAMWQESVESVYEGGLKRSWDYDDRAGMVPKRR